MTSVASFGGATTAGNFTLVHSGLTLGNWVENFRSNGSRLTPIAERQNFWADSVLLDGKYPALIWRHEFLLYTEASSRGDFAKTYFDFSINEVQAEPQLLTVNDGDTPTVRFSFGNCYFETVMPEIPSDLLMHRAGMLRVRFAGTDIPTMIS